MKSELTRAQRTLCAIQAMKRCPVCRREQCDCWTELAAFPDLVAACELTLRLLGDLTTDDFRMGKDRPAREAMEAALRKARGE